MRRTSVPEFGGSDAGYAEHFGSSFDPHLNLTIIHTTAEGTLAALKAASDLARGLHARIRLVMAHVVPFRLPLETPMISVPFLKAREARLVTQSGLDENTVSIEICLCRQPRAALRDYLPVRSLLVIGGKQRWWRDEQRLAKWMAATGHQVLFIDVNQTKQGIFKTFPRATPAKGRKFVSLPPL
jgi:hypothetical protein